MNDIEEGTLVIYKDDLYRYLYSVSVKVGLSLQNKLMIETVYSSNIVKGQYIVDIKDVIICTEEEYPEYYI